jgi:hypothetical protein
MGPGWASAVCADRADATREFDERMAQWTEQVSGFVDSTGIDAAGDGTRRAAGAGGAGSRLSKRDLSLQVIRAGVDAMGAGEEERMVRARGTGKRKPGKDGLAGDDDAGAASSARDGDGVEEEAEAEEEEEEEDTGPSISAAQFKGVSTLVRGRAKIEAVNQVYAVIVAHFEAIPPRERKPITVKELSQLGAKVTGQTGVACLNTLRSLKIIELNKGTIALC